MSQPHLQHFVIAARTKTRICSPFFFPFFADLKIFPSRYRYLSLLCIMDDSDISSVCHLSDNFVSFARETSLILGGQINQFSL